MAKCECAIVITASHTDPNTASIESDEGHEDDIEPTSTHEARSPRFGNAQMIGAGRCILFDEPHRVCAAIDARQIDGTAPRARNFEQGKGWKLFGKSVVKRDSLAWAQAKRLIRLDCDALRG